MRLVVLGDTHIPDFAKSLPRTLLPALHRAELILHAGDVTAPEVLEELAGYAPVHVALGNRDRPEVKAWGALPVVTLDLDGTPLVMIHAAGPRAHIELRASEPCHLQRQDVVARRDTRSAIGDHRALPVDPEGLVTATQLLWGEEAASRRVQVPRPRRADRARDVASNRID